MIRSALVIGAILKVCIVGNEDKGADNEDSINSADKRGCIQRGLTINMFSIKLAKRLMLRMLFLGRITKPQCLRQVGLVLSVQQVTMVLLQDKRRCPRASWDYVSAWNQFRKQTDSQILGQNFWLKVLFF